MYQYDADVVKLISVKLLRVRVTSYSAQTNQIVLEISFEDSAEKQIYQTVTVDNPEETAQLVFDELIKLEENINTDFNGAQFSGKPRVIIQEQDIVKDSLVQFFDTLKRRIERVQHSKDADGYLDLVRAVNGSEVEL